MEIFKKCIHGPVSNSIPRIIQRLIQHDVDFFEKEYLSILDRRPIDILSKLKKGKSIKQLYQQYTPNILQEPLEFQQFYQTKYKRFTISIIVEWEEKIDGLFVKDPTGRNFLYYLFVFYPEYKPIFGTPETLKKYESALQLYVYFKTGIPRLTLEEPRFYLFTNQSKFHKLLTPSSKSLQQFPNDLTVAQKQILKQKHTLIDKQYYTGSYGVYFQLTFQPLSWFTDNKINLATETCFVFDAVCLLSKIRDDMKKAGITRIPNFIYFNPGWYFGDVDEKTITMKDTVTAFLTETQPFSSSRNEVIIRWIIPCVMDYGLLKTTKKLK
jgi:hypothetical protein